MKKYLDAQTWLNTKLPCQRYNQIHRTLVLISNVDIDVSKMYRMTLFKEICQQYVYCLSSIITYLPYNFFREIPEVTSGCLRVYFARAYLNILHDILV